MSLRDNFLLLKETALQEVAKIKSSAEVEVWRQKYLGRKGELSHLLKLLQDTIEKEKPVLGQLANQIKNELQTAYQGLLQGLTGESLDKSAIDVTVPGKKLPVGSIHPLMQVQRDLEDIFRSMGFRVLDGPELEDEYHNFEALNIPAWHPARDTQDTFYVKGGQPVNRWLLRTHTSPVQIRAMKEYGAPLRAVVPGRVFRYEATDASHEHTFWQMEGLVIDTDISIANLVAVMSELLAGIFKRQVEVRLRPGYFPFVEPGFELDIRCFICAGQGCSVCKQRGWVELLPCGLVHPNVLKAGGIDPKKYSGLAFGLGLSRLAMMRYKIDDIRLFLSGDLRFLKQF
ncbi:phenylalanine--tRNA ligase subunit alpha [Patescibacteria group bacterium]|nr:phenylalanine--tRNA ligase subunit alpha [Patescibacteria group bacterium]